MALDEAHSIKNAGTSKYRKLLQITCVRRVLLTGTPINNSLPELLVLLQFLMVIVRVFVMVVVIVIAENACL